jgi:formylglycine-generating enzyme required for sulfatase activity
LSETKIILLLAANPKGTASLRLQEEEREIKERLRLAGYGKIPIHSAGATRARDIQQAMVDFNPQVVHFCGHGTGTAGLAFEDINGQEKLVSSEALADTFGLFADRVECVIINACFSETQAEAISQYIDYAIGMSQPIGDEAAIEFAIGFYTALGAGKPYEFAYKMGRNAIHLAGLPENMTPILFKKNSLTNKFQSSLYRKNGDIRHQVVQRSMEDNLIKSKFKYEQEKKSFKLDKEILQAETQLFLSAPQQQNDASLQEVITSLNLTTSTFEFNVITIDAKGIKINSNLRQGYCFVEDLGTGVTLEMVVVLGGNFIMGSQDQESRRYPNERPQRSVTMKPFLISKYPITQSQWRAIASLPIVQKKLQLHPSYFKGKNCPVEQVSWHDAVEFCCRLSNKTGNKYRLPTEAEWEYTCRAGSQTSFHFGESITSDLANYDGNYIYRSAPKGINREKTTSVGSFQVANAFGVCDMHGNVWEWCLDHCHDSYSNAPVTGEEPWLNSNDKQERILRGGSWRNEPLLCRSTYRRCANVNQAINNIGFRIICSI